VDKDFVEIDVIKEEFPDSTVLLCQFHVLKYLKKKLTESEMKVKEIVRKDLYVAIHAAVYAKSETEYILATNQMLQLLGNDVYHAYSQYFLKNWDNCKDAWSNYLRNKYYIGNTTNNRLENFGGKIKKWTPRTTPLHVLVDKLADYAQYIDNESKHKIKILLSYSRALPPNIHPTLQQIFPAVSDWTFDIIKKQVELAVKHHHSYTHVTKGHMVEVYNKVGEVICDVNSVLLTGTCTTCTTYGLPC